jgi:hypothetical protein
VRRESALLGQQVADDGSAAFRRTISGARPGAPLDVVERARAAPNRFLDYAFADLVTDADELVGLDDRASYGSSSSFTQPPFLSITPPAI